MRTWDGDLLDGAALGAVGIAHEGLRKRRIGARFAPGGELTTHPVALAGLLAWGLIHIAGGLSLLTTDTAEALDTLAPNATNVTPISPGEAATAVVRFHARNIALGGFAVTALASLWCRRRRAEWMRNAAFGIAVALDIGLIAFLVGPGLLPASQGLIGPILVALVAAAVAAEHRHPLATT